jgi:hypothetical protein
MRPWMGEGFHPNRPKTVVRNHTIPQKVTDVSNYGYLKVRGPGKYPQDRGP